MPKKATEQNKKVRIGWFTFTCCEGCATVFVELLNDHFAEWREQLEFTHCRILKSKNVLDNLDIAIVEGAISVTRDIDKLKLIRKNSKYVMAVGACALTGMPAGLRNNFNSSQLKEIKPILKKFGNTPKVERVSKFIKLDSQVPGCPMSDKLFLNELNNYLIKFGVKT